MKKLRLIVLLTITTPLFSLAQLRIALVGGPHVSTIKETNNLPGWDSISRGYTARPGFHVGFIGDLQLGQKSSFYFQPGFVFYNKGRKYSNVADSFYSTTDTSFATRYLVDGTQYLNYIDIPLNLVFKKKLGEKAKFMVGGGPYLSFFYNGVEKTSSNLVGVDFKSEENNDLAVGKGTDKYRTMDIGVNALAGIEFKKIFLTAQYSRSITDMYEAAYPGSFKHQVIGATLGIFIGQPVDLSDKPKDRDNDGVIDIEDLCPEEPGAAITQGCPDSDGDGIADQKDKCPGVSGVLRFEGCPIPDSDKDGVNDEEDECPQVAGLQEFKGCPVPDTDGDGVNDKEDKCKDIAGLAKYAGCPIPDTDTDGVNDEQDRCPDVPGLKENNGCPAVKEEIVEKVNFVARQIQFKTGKSILTDPSKKLLDEVAELLNTHPELQINIEGHTSSEGDPRYNQRLSETRAEAVKNYLLAKGVSADRLASIGYGSSQLLNQERTATERSLNRRVELKLKNN